MWLTSTINDNAEPLSPVLSLVAALIKKYDDHSYLKVLQLEHEYGCEVCIYTVYTIYTYTWCIYMVCIRIQFLINIY
jgi:hypothetical protein